jgi:hypothetical protein
MSTSYQARVIEYNVVLWLGPIEADCESDAREQALNTPGVTEVLHLEAYNPNEPCQPLPATTPAPTRSPSKSLAASQTLTGAM